MVHRLKNRFKRFLVKQPQPEQLLLFVLCSVYGDTCDYSEDLFHGAFYNACWKCGERYAPVNDR